jgi:hypothetical protein
LLPEIYHGPPTLHTPYGGLTGDLTIFLALMALSMQPEYLSVVLPMTRSSGKWKTHLYPHGSKFNNSVAVTGANNTGNDKRGVIVTVYCSSELGSTPEDLQAYENGVYGKYFD